MARWPFSALRSTHMTSGLFDIEPTVKIDTPLLPVEQDELDWTTLNAYDVFDSLENGGGSYAGGSGDFSDLDTNLSLGEDTDFKEVFTDLSEFLLGEQGMAMSAMGGEDANVPSNPVGVKRSASVAIDVTEVALKNTDHDDYVSKPKRAKRVSSISSSVTDLDLDDCGSVAGDKDTKYLERRRKNNIASRRSRESRKNKFTDMEQKAIELEKSNERLRKQIEQLERATKIMKDTLVKKLAGK